MPVSNEKSSKFLDAINKYAEEQRNQINEEVERFKAEELEKAETEILNDVYHLIQNEMAEMRLSIVSELSRKQMSNRKELFIKRQLITDEVFKKASEKLVDFTNSKEYTVLLKKYAAVLASVLTQPGTILYIRAADAAYTQLISDAFGKECTVQAANDIVLGGIRGYNAAMGLVADETLDSKLEAQHEWFMENSGMRVV